MKIIRLFKTHAPIILTLIVLGILCIGLRPSNTPPLFRSHLFVFTLFIIVMVVCIHDKMLGSLWLLILCMLVVYSRISSKYPERFKNCKAISPTVRDSWCNNNCVNNVCDPGGDFHSVCDCTDSAGGRTSPSPSPSVVPSPSPSPSSPPRQSCSPPLGERAAARSRP